MSADQARQPAGVPTGGQFATGPRTEAHVELDTPMGHVREALERTAAEVLAHHPQARWLALHEVPEDPEPLVVSYFAWDHDRRRVWLSPDAADAVHGHLAVVGDVVRADACGLLTSVHPSGLMGVLDLHRAAGVRRADAA